MHKQVIILRTDVRMGKGKLISQGIHAAIGSMKLAGEETIRKWENERSKKVVLKTRNVGELKEIVGKLKKNKIPHFLVKDAGLTQLKAGTVTALGIGPAEEKKINKITGKMKLL